MTDKPVPWTQARREALEQLVAKARPTGFYGYHEELLEACADVVAAARGNDLVFVGRSPEPLYDLLESIFSDTSQPPTITLLPFSLRDHDSGAIRKVHNSDEESIVALENHFSDLNLGPADIAQSKNGISFVDFVCWGTTLGNLEETLEFMATRQGMEPTQVTSNIRYTGITKESVGWTHWRNDEESQGARFFAENRASVVTVSAKLWNYLTDFAGKTTNSFVSKQWKSGVEFPALNEETARAIRSALDLRICGIDREVRRSFAGKLSRRAGQDDKWLRSLVVRMLKSTSPRRQLGLIRRQLNRLEEELENLKSAEQHKD